MKRRLSGCIAVLCLGAAGLASAAGNEQETFSPWNGWSQIADGVYQKTDSAGVTRRVAFGSGGARYDRQQIQQNIDRLRAGKDQSDETRAAIADLAAQLDRIPVVSDNTVVPANSSNGTACSAAYQFDSDFAVGTAGANLITRAHAGFPFSPPPGETVSLNSLGKIYDTPGGTYSGGGTGSGYGGFATGIANYDHFPMPSTACTASSSSSIDYTGPCVDHVSLIVNYPSCVTGSIP